MKAKRNMASAWMMGVAISLGWLAYREAQKATSHAAGADQSIVVLLQWGSLSVLAVLPFWRLYGEPLWLVWTSILTLFGWLTVVAGYPLYVGGNYHDFSWSLTVYAVVGAIVYAYYRSLDTRGETTAPLLLTSLVPSAVVAIVALLNLAWLTAHGYWLSTGAVMLSLVTVVGTVTAMRVLNNPPEATQHL
ncbi:MAG: hypothetical protein KatS3mg023_2324 [Armatimonadota bacterium]|nr:MAG: hypothetical protein KatS3mg023_2324 [Armatimonadota bacterium]